MNAAQSSNGTSSSSENHVLAADLDWGVDLRAEALVAGKVVGERYRHSFTGNRHLWWRDLAPGGSTALDALVVSVAPAVVQQQATFRVRMPSCYPYTSPVRYHVSWTGNAVPSNIPGCTWQAEQGDCVFDPHRDLVIGMTWPVAGSDILTVVAIGDDHDNGLRRFTPAPAPKPLTVTVRSGP